MTIRAMLLELSASSGLSINTLKARWRSGYRGDELAMQRIPYRRKKADDGPVPTAVTRGPSLPVRVPDSLRYR